MFMPMLLQEEESFLEMAAGLTGLFYTDVLTGIIIFREAAVWLHVSVFSS